MRSWERKEWHFWARKALVLSPASNWDRTTSLRLYNNDVCSQNVRWLFRSFERSRDIYEYQSFFVALKLFNFELCNLTDPLLSLYMNFSLYYHFPMFSVWSSACHSVKPKASPDGLNAQEYLRKQRLQAPKFTHEPPRRPTRLSYHPRSRVRAWSLFLWEPNQILRLRCLLAIMSKAKAIFVVKCMHVISLLLGEPTTLKGAPPPLILS